jgi:mannose-1-phosphate guanylyltransferase/mannose-1-phosphate guanylyltransferase/mannose-6-phosphate isomerase
MVATLGLNNLVVIATEKAILVADKSQSQKVKQVVEALKKDNNIQYL